MNLRADVLPVEEDRGGTPSRTRYPPAIPRVGRRIGAPPTSRRPRTRPALDPAPRLGVESGHAHSLVPSNAEAAIKYKAALVLALGLLAAPLAAGAQVGGRTPRIGYLSFFEPRPRDDDFRQGLRALGWVDGQNLVIESRFAERDLSRVRRFAEELVRLNVVLIVTTTGRSTAVVREVTRTVPIVMMGAGDAVRQGLVASLARPGGNVTGLTNITPEVAGKRLELLKETLPRLSRVALVGCWDGPVGQRERQEVQAAAAALELHLFALALTPGADFKAAVKSVVEQRAEAMLVGDCPTGLPPAQQLAHVALQHRLPTLGAYESLARAGGLMAYGPSEPDLYRRAATYVDKILKGAKPADLPVEQPTKFELVINMKTAKALGLTIPQSVLMRADEVIQ